VTAWNNPGTNVKTNVFSVDIFPIIVPHSNGQDMYAIWYQNDGTQGYIEGRRFSSGAWSGGLTNIGSSGVTNPDGRGPSAVTDSLYTIHVIFSDINGHLMYVRIAGPAVTIPVSLDNINPPKLYPTITLVPDTPNDDLYAFWINSSAGTSQITGKYSTSGGVPGSWIWISGITTNSTSKRHLTSVYSVTSNSEVGWQWNLNQAFPPMYDIQFERLPEFSDAMIPIVIIVSLTFYLRRRRKKRELDKKEEIT
jgi:hypothetical protein